MSTADTRFTILALAPFHPIPDDIPRLRLVEADPAAPDAVLSELGPTLRISAPRELCPEGSLTLDLHSRRAFTPEGLLESGGVLSALATARAILAQGGADPARAAAKALEAAPGLPEPVREALARTGQAKNPGIAPPPPPAPGLLDDILDMVAAPAAATGGGPAARSDLAGGLEMVDRTLASLLSLILADPAFRASQAAFAGLRALMRQGGLRPGGPVRLLAGAVSPASLAPALASLTTQMGETPPGLTIVDLPLSSSPRDMDLLREALEAADSLLMPTALWAGPEFLHLPSWTGLGKIPYLTAFFEDASFAKWRKLKEAPGAAWTALTCCGFAAREAWGPSNPSGPVTPAEPAPPVAAPVWALAALVAASTIRFGLPCRFTDYRQLRLTNLPILAGGATEVLLSDDRLLEFVECGLLPLAGMRGRDEAFIPKEASLAGESFAFRLLLADVLGYLFRCRKEDAQELEQGDLSANLAGALAGFFRSRNLEPPADLLVSPGQEPALSVSMTLPASAVPGGQRLEFGFVW